MKFDFREYDKHLGHVVRGIDELARAYPELKKADEFVEIERLRDSFGSMWKKLRNMAVKIKE